MGIHRYSGFILLWLPGCQPPESIIFCLIQRRLFSVIVLFECALLIRHKCTKFRAYFWTLLFRLPALTEMCRHTDGEIVMSSAELLWVLCVVFGTRDLNSLDWWNGESGDVKTMIWQQI